MPRFTPMLGLMQELFEVLHRRRRRRGAIDFDLPETEVVLSEFGQIEAILPSERNVAHRLIEEFMLLANQTVASHLVAHAAPALHRVHEAPDIRKVEDFEAFVTPLGYSLGTEGRAVRPKYFQRLIDHMRGTPEERPIATLMLRTMQKARYDASSLGHFRPGRLSTTRTSRRRFDGTQIWLFTGRLGRSGRLTCPRCAATNWKRSCPRSRVRHRRGNAVPTMRNANSCSGRRSASWPTRLATTTTGTSPASRPFGLFVELIEHYVEGLVHISTMVDDYYRFTEQHHTLVGESTKRTYRLGDQVHVQVVRVDMDRRQVDLGLTEILDAVRREARPQGAGKRTVALKNGRVQRPGRTERLGRTKGKPRRAKR